MKSRAMRIKATFLALVLVLSVALAGCGDNAADENMPNNASQTSATGEIVTESSEEKIILRIVTEEGSDETVRFDDQLERLIKRYEYLNKNVDIVLEHIPQMSGNDIALQRLRSEILAGDGPDIFLLSCEQHYDSEPLIKDVNLAMRNGIFTDISKYYDADTELGKESLNTTVMNAGVVDGARYVLPLRYNFPVVYVNVDKLAESGLTTDSFQHGIINLLDTTVQYADETFAFNGLLGHVRRQYTLNFFPHILDYDNQEILITEDELMTYMRSSQAVRKLNDGRQPQVHLYSYFGTFPDPYWGATQNCVLIDDLEAAIANVSMAQAYGINLEMIPLTASDGSLVADVTFYGAIGGQCEHPDIAYDFLRQLLTEDFQWEKNTEVHNDYVKYTALAREGWPVRTVGSVAPLAKSTYDQIVWDNSKMKLEFRLQDMTDDNIPLLQTKIDHVRFSIPLERELERIVREEVKENSTEADMRSLADQWLQALQWHLFEG